MGILAIAAAFALAAGSAGIADPARPEPVVVRNGALQLHALLWRPAGPGPFPAVLFNHGSGNGTGWQPEAVGRVFAEHGYEFLFLFRRGSGPSVDQGVCAEEQMARELAARGQEARNALQLRLLEGDDLSDALAGLAFLRSRPEADPRRLAVVGHSFGASLTLLLLERDPSLRAAVSFSGSAASWEKSPQLRSRLLAAVGRATAPILFVFAANDYSTGPAQALGAELQRLGKAHRVEIFPPWGKDADQGHGFVFSGVATWEPVVFAFLDGILKRGSTVPR